MFADSGLSDELAEKIVAFVDREAGRDAPLTADDEAMVRRMIDSDPAVRELVEDLRATNAGLDTLLDDVAAVEVPERLVALIHGHGSDDIAVMTPKSADGSRGSEDETGDSGVVSLAHPPVRRRSYGPLAAAASIALMISSGALYYIYDTANTERSRLQTALATASDEAEAQQRALADTRAELERLTSLAELASNQSEETTGQLLANEEAIQELEVERATLEGRYAALESRNQRLSERLDQQRADVTSSEAERDRLSADLADARQALGLAEAATEETRTSLAAEVQDLTSRLDQREQDVAALTEELESGEERSEAARADLATIRGEQADLERRLATAELDKQQLEAERTAALEAVANAEQRLASLETTAEGAEGRVATALASQRAAEEGRQEALQLVEGLETDLAASRNWLGQIAQYHRVYASTARRHLVEVGADELDHIQEWMTGMLGREIEVPDLTEFGVTFAGARLLGINDRPVAQLVYIDANDQPLALCIIPSTREVTDPTLSADGELNLVDWHDGNHGYAVVGWSDPELLTSLSEAIRPVYDL